MIRDVTGSYDLAWFLAGALCMVAAVLSIAIRRNPPAGRRDGAAARRGDVLSAVEIAGVLWPQESPSDPDAVVASLVSRLRRVPCPDAVLGGREGYRLGGRGDRRRPGPPAARGRRAGGTAPAGRGRRGALELLESTEASAAEPDDDSMAPVRSEVTVLRRRARHLLARTALETGDTGAAEDAARRALADDPLDEEAVRLLMRALLARDLPAEALRTYERLRQGARRRAGHRPAPVTRTLYDVALQEAPVDPAGAVARRPTGCGSPGATIGLLRAGWEGACGHRAGSSSSCRGNPASARSRLLEELAETARRSGGAVLSRAGLRG